MAKDLRELYVMIARPKGRGASAIQLSQDIWKVEAELDLLYSSAKNAYESYADPGESGILLNINGTLVLSYPSKKECNEKFEDFKQRLAKATSLPTIKYEALELDRYKISEEIPGMLENIAPKELVDFLHGKRQKIQYTPKQISYEFLDPKDQRNFIRITFDKVTGEKKLLLNVTVESNSVEYAKKTIKEIEHRIGK